MVHPNIVAVATLRFTRNAANTPVWLLATGDIVIEGKIDVSGSDGGSIEEQGRGGSGGPGGFDGGKARLSDISPQTPGNGPGGGLPKSQGEAGVFASAMRENVNVYGNSLLTPLIGGSGGCGYYRNLTGDPITGGGGGGGAILLASSTKIELSGAVEAKGGGVMPPTAGPGSGGAIRLIAPVVAGNGAISVSGGDHRSGDPGSAGWSRIDSADPFSHRNITMSGRAFRGAHMFVFPPNRPTLNVIEAAGQAIPEGTISTVQVTYLRARPQIRRSGF